MVTLNKIYTSMLKKYKEFKKGFPSDIKKLYIEIDPLSLTVQWIAVVGPSEDGRCYACMDSRGSAGGGLSAVNGQIPIMHRGYPSMQPKLILDFNEDVRPNRS